MTLPKSDGVYRYNGRDMTSALSPDAADWRIGRRPEAYGAIWINPVESVTMTRSEKFLCAMYALIAVVALIATWSNNLAFMARPENRTLQSWYDGVYANYAAASFTNDLFMLAIAGSVFMVVEGRRLHMRFVWVYILLSGPTAISVVFPLFLLARQITIARRRD